MRSAVASTLVALSGAAAVVCPACYAPKEARRDADEAAYEIIEKAQQRALGRTEPFAVETAADSLRRRLLLDQKLPYSDPSSLGSKDVEPIEQWPDKDYFEPRRDEEPPPWSGGQPLELSLLDALQIGAKNSREYQAQKELVFQTALALDLERDRFRSTWAGILSSGVEFDELADPHTAVWPSGADVGVLQRFKNGTLLTLNLAVDLAQLLTGSEESSLGILGDATIAIPLLRGSGRFVVTEPLKQAERDTVYAIYQFERFKRGFAVQIATEFYSVLQLHVEAKNQEENYRWLIGATRRAARMQEAQRLERIQLDQTRQDELDARDSWVEALTVHESRLDQFKQLLGLPVDAEIALDVKELEPLAAAFQPPAQGEPERVAADAPIEIVPPSREGGGPLEMDPREAVLLALQNRLDLRIAVGRVFDAQRNVAVTADRLRADLTLFGSAAVGQSRTSASDALLPNASPRLDEGSYSVIALLGLPLERTAERNLYRNSLFGFEQAVRDAQALEDQVKFEVREDLRVLRESRERLSIQTQSVLLAEQRVESTSRFLEVSRAEARDVLEAQTDLVDSRNAQSLEQVRYRLAELALQRDLDLLQVDQNGLWTEFDPSTPKAP